jgi:hypothetical protein
VHRTVRCAPDSVRCLGWLGDELVALEKKIVALRLKFTGLSGEPKTPAPTVSWSHRTIRCANGTEGPTVRRARYGRRSGTGQLLFMSGGAPDYPMRHPAKGKNCLSIGSPTASSCLGAINGTPRRMEQYTKHSQNILRRLDSATMQSNHRV